MLSPSGPPAVGEAAFSMNMLCIKAPVLKGKKIDRKKMVTLSEFTLPSDNTVEFKKQF